MYNMCPQIRALVVTLPYFICTIHTTKEAKNKRKNWFNIEEQFNTCLICTKADWQSHSWNIKKQIFSSGNAKALVKWNIAIAIKQVLLE